MKLTDDLPSFNDLFGSLSAECHDMVIEYSDKIVGYGEDFSILFNIIAVNGCRTPSDFQNRLLELCRPNVAKLTDIAANCMDILTSKYIQEIAAEFAGLTDCVLEDIEVFDESEYGLREEHKFMSFCMASFKGTKDDQIKNYRQSILRKASDFAVAWLEVITDNKQKINYLSYACEMALSRKIINKSEVALEPYIALARINELKAIDTREHDLTRIVRLCEELNEASEHQMHYATAILVRAIIDHIPPIFGKTSFADLSGSYGTRSFRDSMIHLDKSLRKIADAFLHTPIRKQEILPTKNQVNFSQDIDVLLSEICRIKKNR